MKATRWLARLLARWRGSAPRSDRGERTSPREIDIDLSAADAAASDESTDYDVHSLGDPIDPPATARHAGR